MTCPASPPTRARRELFTPHGNAMAPNARAVAPAVRPSFTPGVPTAGKPGRRPAWSRRHPRGRNTHALLSCPMERCASSMKKTRRPVSSGQTELPKNSRMVSSPDGGATWSTPQIVMPLREFLPTDASGHPFYALFDEAVTADQSGTLYVVSTDNTSAASDTPSTVTLRISHDGGSTWAQPK